MCPPAAGPDGPTVAVGTRVSSAEPLLIAPGIPDGLAAWLAGVSGVPADPSGHLPTLPAVLGLTAAAGAGGPGALLAQVLAQHPGAAVVHGEQRIEAVRPVVAGDRLLFTSTLESSRAMGQATVVAVSTRVTDAGGGPVARLRSSFVLTGPAA